MENSYSLLWPILIPLFGGLCTGFLPVLRPPKRRNIFVTVVLAATLAATLCILPGERELLLLRLMEGAEIYLRRDALSGIFAVLFCVMWLLSGIFSFEYMEREKHRRRYYTCFLVTLSPLLGLAFAGNFLTMYVCFEWLTLVSMLLVLHKGSKTSIGASLNYLMYSLGGASLGLLGLPLALCFGTSTRFVPGGVLDAAAVQGHEGVILCLAFAAAVGFGAKAGLFPLFAWLPMAHPVAPAPASAVLSGVITKAGVLAILRLIYYQIGPEFLRGTWVQAAWAVIALITVLIGSTLALKEQVLKKRLAYSTVSQVSYILFGLFVMNGTALTGALLHVLAHSICKDALFLAVGAIIFQTQKTRADELRGIGKEMPAVLWAFTAASLGLVGIPPLCGFLSKWYLCLGALDSGLPVLDLLGPAVLIVSAILTAAYLLPVTVRGFFPGAGFPAPEKREPGRRMTVPLLILTAATAFTVYPKPYLDLVGAIVSRVF